MSMWLSACRVSPEAFAEIQKAPSLLETMFFDSDEGSSARLKATLGIESADSFGVDFLSLSAAYEAMAEATGEEVGDDILEEDLNPSGALEYEAGYGPAFFLDPQRVAAAQENSMIPEMDEDAKAVFDAAVEHKSYLVGVIS